MKHFFKLIKRSYFKVGLFCYLGLLLCSVQPAEAALISASAAIDWSTFKITPIDIGNGLPTLTWTNQYDSSYACSDCGNGISESASNWSTGTLASENASTSTFSNSASASTSLSEIKADASINGSFNQYLYANSNSQRSGNFTVQGNGLLLFQANYSLADDVGTASSPYASSNVNFNLNSYNDGGNGYGSASLNFYRDIHSGSPPVAETGILGVALVFNDGWRGDFSASTSASVYGFGSPSPIPLPAAFWLFGSALAGIAALRRPNSAS